MLARAGTHNCLARAGLGSLMLADGFKRTSPKPIHLEATTPRTLAMYSHWGFEVDEEHQFGRGAVDVNGLQATGEAATGYPEWVMTKVGLLHSDRTDRSNQEIQWES